MPQSPVTTKTLLTRAQRRAVLRYQLRDTGSTVWANEVLNSCLDEALTYVHTRHPWVRSATLTGQYRTFDLPDDFVSMRQVVLMPAVDELGATLDNAPPGRVITGYNVASVSGGRGFAASADTHDKVLVLDEELDSDDTLMIFYDAALQPWGTITDVNTGQDEVIKDLCPGTLMDGGAELLFYAAARCAAFRQALGYIKGDSGDDWAAQYEYALRERDRLMGECAPTTVVRLTNGLF